MADLDYAIGKGSFEVGSFFKSKKAVELIPYLNHPDVSGKFKKLQSGHYTALKLIRKKRVFYMFGDENTLSEKNFDFVIPIN